MVEAMPEFLEKLKKATNMRLPSESEQPCIVFVDRGEGFYKSNGQITQTFAKALRQHGLKAFHGQDAEFHPGRSGDLWLHETAVTWIRQRLKRNQPTIPLQESEAQLGARLQAAAEHINAQYDVDGLCKEFPGRMHDLVHVTKGGKLQK